MRGTFFVENLSEGKFGETAIKAHPGVTLMWIAGPAGYLASGIDYVKMGGSVLKFLAHPIQTSRENVTTTRQFALKIRQTSVAVVNSIVTLLACVWFGMALNSGFAVVLSAFLVGFDPYYLGLSRIIHCDSLMATFIIASCTAVFRFLFNEHFSYKWIIISGAFAGLGILSKITGAVVVPWFVLVLFVFAWFHFSPKNVSPLFRFVSSVKWIFPKILLWSISLVTVFVAVWPAMWVSPKKALGLIFKGTMIAANNVHQSSIDSLLQKHVGICSYFPRLLIFSAPWIVWIFVFGACFILLSHFLSSRNKKVCFENKSEQRDRADRFCWIFISCALLFFSALNIISLGLFQKQAARYIISSMVAIDLVAVIVLYRVVIISCLTNVFSQRLVSGVLIILVAWFVYTAFKWIPYATGYRHPIWADLKVNGRSLQRGWGEGLEEAAKVLNRLDGSENLIVALRHFWIFKIFFKGTSVEYDKMTRHKVDYIVLYEILWDSNSDSQLVKILTENCEPFETIYLKPFGNLPIAKIYESSCYYTKQPIL